ncbi:MAG: sulfotransferase family protein, partial [Planctomycetota bacterium]
MNTSSGEPPRDGQRVVAILGMHRSGTSLLAGTLQQCGLELGDVNTQAPANEKGNRESWLLMALHEDLLRKAGGFWHTPPVRPVIWTRLHEAMRRLFIDEFAGIPLWGFKDPRLLHLLDGWLEVLPELETVGIFRHPLEVAESLRKRTPSLFPGDAAERLWLDHNRRLLAWHDRTGCPLLEFVADRAAFHAATVAVA